MWVILDAMRNAINNLLKEVRGNPSHSKEFLALIKEAKDTKHLARGIRTITHAKPLLVFWIAPNGQVLDAGNAHRENPPKGDKSVLSDPQHGGHIRGRAAYIGNTVYIVIYGRSDTGIVTKAQISLLRRSYPKLFSMIKKKNSSISTDDINSAIFIDEYGKELII